jgi:hypothetical protein
VARYDHTINLGIGYLREAREIGEIGAMDDEQIEREARAVFALMDGMQLQWLLNPSLPVAQMFKAQLDPVLQRWEQSGKPRRRSRAAAAKDVKEPETGASAARA